MPNCPREHLFMITASVGRSCNNIADPSFFCTPHIRLFQAIFVGKQLWFLIFLAFCYAFMIFMFCPQGFYNSELGTYMFILDPSDKPVRFVFVNKKISCGKWPTTSLLDQNETGQNIQNFSNRSPILRITFLI